ncbi:MAG: transglycosylase SLT domain-containing protein [Alphaproteobacteria bacterium]|nr:transglycosylase SLT domain-containing protein [Alphaproteobacteria bacterium]
MFARLILGALLGIVASAGSAVAETRTNPETAAIAPGLSNRTAADPLPAVLSAKDASLYAEIFRIQRDGNWQRADALIAQLTDRSLMGHVLFQRYMHPTKYRSTYGELKDWMSDYADHPGASRIYKLALRRRPANYKYPAKPRATELPSMDAVEAAVTDILDEAETGVIVSRRFEGKSRSERNRIRGIQRSIRSLVQRGNVTIALEKLDTAANKRLFDAVSYAESLGVIARGYYRYHLDDKAMAVAAEAEALAGDGAALAHWWGGLSAFRAENWDRAAAHFDQLSVSAEADEWLKAAGGFWASRAYLIGGKPHRVSDVMMRAAAYPRTFYGLLAVQALGEQLPFNFDMPVMSETEVELLYRIPAAHRALALIESGQTDLADAELRRFVDELPPSFAGTLLAFADRAGLADVAFRIGRDMARKQNTLLDGALYPLPGWQPSDGFKVDRALVYAIVRQESQFRTRAISHAGARGLMQLMPATAGYMAGQRFRGAGRDTLFDPGLNLSLGQKYVSHVLGLKEINGNLLYALAAYNAGPGNLNRWRKRIDYSDDPLLFIESLPSRETRNYIEHVLSNYWIYRLRLGQHPISMDALIGGDWPVYVQQDGETKLIPVSGTGNPIRP